MEGCVFNRSFGGCGIKQSVVYRVTIQYYKSRRKKVVRMRRARESDCDWRFLDGKRGSELAYEWNVIKAVKE